ncbi:peptidoglycan -binding protein [Phaeovulum vinaykumarii]|uniref:Chemotaxis protein MotB n=1 Tax=Phaeovulum vinaykumarii TaxID=407234 RepID=A0A1N7JSX1_9RHOB|nr:peptidoglycan -binding protein [Phaeovulum vinaykumarii]SIS52417.1 chemotaxis protein MotB [Phaeovulum vinaykumarii]SOB91213.1 chemotaxis protein MotB [Phaeovulum vinaykumarii]
MRLARRSTERFSATIWPGFVDAMTALLLVLMFVLSIFMLVQSMLRDTITTQGSELDALSARLSELGNALSLEKARAGDLADRLSASQTLVATLSADLGAAKDRIGGLTADLAAERDRAAGLSEDLSAARGQIADLEADLDTTREAELAARTALDESRRKAEETLTLLAAAEAAKRDLETRESAALSEAERVAALRAVAEDALAREREVSAEGQKKLALLNEQIAALRGQMAALQEALDASEARDREARVQIDALGSRLNAALARVAAEERKRADLEAAEAARLAAEARDLARYRSEFFGRMSELLAGRAGVKVVGDRFVLSSEVLFPPGSADLSDEGRAEIGRVTAMLKDLSAEIPPEIDWIIRVDGHTDNQPLSGEGEFRDNWQLSQARALSVVRYMTNDLGFAPERLAAAGFGEYRPVAPGNSATARAQNRRIELKLTER